MRFSLVLLVGVGILAIFLYKVFEEKIINVNNSSEIQTVNVFEASEPIEVNFLEIASTSQEKETIQTAISDKTELPTSVPEKIIPITNLEPQIIIAQTASNSDEYYKGIIQKLINSEVTWEELGSQGVNDDEVSDYIEIESIVEMLNYRSTPYPAAEDYVVFKSKTQSDEFGIAVVSQNELVELYMYDVVGAFSGIIQFGADGLGLPVEKIKGVDLYTFIDRGFMVSVGERDASVFLNVKTAGIASLYTRIGNDDAISYAFPVTTQTKGSATFKRTLGSIIFQQWNIDVDGDGGTDVSFGHTGPSKEEIRLMFNVIQSDRDLPQTEKSYFSDELYAAFVKVI